MGKAMKLALLLTSLLLGIQYSESSGCGLKAYAEDKHCDDENNNAACKWDGGACCETTNEFYSNKDFKWNAYCKLCKCLDPNHKGPVEPKKPKGKKSPKGHDHEPKSPKGKSPKGPSEPEKP